MHDGVAGMCMTMTEELVRQRTRSNMELARELHYSRTLRTLRRAERMERKAERRMLEAWRRAAELRAAAGFADY
jgi:hypothetical protein